MAELLTIARPYAQAVFSLAKETDSLSVWSERLDDLAQIATNDEAMKVTGNPAISATQAADLFLSLLGETQCNELESLVRLLARNERLSLLPFIRNLYNDLMSADQGLRTVELVSAFAMSDEQLQGLTTELEKFFSSRLKPEVTIDSALIGGFTAKVGSKVYDASVRGKLDAMSGALKKN